MFKSLATKFNNIFSSISQSKVVSEEDVEKAVKEIRIALLEADVALDAVKAFTISLKDKFAGEQVVKKTNPVQTIIKLTQDEITGILSLNHKPFELEKNKLNIILMAGLQGAGKTTTTAKLAYKLKNKGENVILASLDTRRPAAKLQLKILADKIGVSSLEIIEEETAEKIAKRALDFAQKHNFSVLILDTAGRMEVDLELMEELELIKNITKPTHVLLTMDSLAGRQSLNVASKFNDLLNVDGIILTRMESDTRGGIAFNIKFSLKKAIMFYGTGEDIKDFEEFYPERIASRILDMGDVVSLVEKAKDIMEEKEMEKMKKKMEKGDFDLEDFLTQIRSLKKMGGFGKLLSFIPGASKLTEMVDDEKQKSIYMQEAIILSMTKKERKKPEMISNSYSRKSRIANGSGTKLADVNKLLKQFDSMKSMMQKFGKLDKSALAKMQDPKDIMKMLS